MPDITAQHERGAQVRLQHLVPVVFREFVRRVAPLDTSSVEEDVDGVIGEGGAGGERGDDSGHGCGGGEVGDKDDALTAEGNYGIVGFSVVGVSLFSAGGWLAVLKLRTLGART